MNLSILPIILLDHFYFFLNATEKSAENIPFIILFDYRHQENSHKIIKEIVMPVI